MKRMAFVASINNGWALLTFGEMDEEQMDVHLGTLYQFITDEVREEDFLEIDFAEDQKTILHARKLVEETKKQKQEAIALRNRLKYGTSRGPNVLESISWMWVVEIRLFCSSTTAEPISLTAMRRLVKHLLLIISPRHSV